MKKILILIISVLCIGMTTQSSAQCDHSNDVTLEQIIGNEQMKHLVNIHNKRSGSSILRKSGGTSEVNVLTIRPFGTTNAYMSQYGMNPDSARIATELYDKDMMDEPLQNSGLGNLPGTAHSSIYELPFGPYVEDAMNGNFDDNLFIFNIATGGANTGKEPIFGKIDSIIQADRIGVIKIEYPHGWVIGSSGNDVVGVAFPVGNQNLIPNSNIIMISIKQVVNYARNPSAESLSTGSHECAHVGGCVHCNCNTIMNASASLVQVFAFEEPCLSKFVLYWTTVCNFWPNTVDADGDGFDETVDCDDNDPDTYPGAPELCDGIDNNCDGIRDTDLGDYPDLHYFDFDRDGYGDSGPFSTPCFVVLTDDYVTIGGDCDDDNPNINPDAPEICDGIDNNCDGDIDEGLLNEYFPDEDGDTYGFNPGRIRICDPTPPPGFVNRSGDCDDTDPTIYLGAPEICDGKDNNCNSLTDADELLLDDGVLVGGTTYYLDSDNDSYGDPDNSVVDCTQPSGYVLNNTDCDDNRPDVYPGATEVCDGMDNNCDGTVDEGVTIPFYADGDDDGFGDPNNMVNGCDANAPMGFVSDNTDCDDTDPTINPDAVDIPNDGIDQDCDGVDEITDGIHDIAGQEIKIYPNPVNDILNIEYKGLDLEIRLVSTTGMALYSTVQDNKIDMSNIPSGAYMLIVTDRQSRISITDRLIIL